MYYILVTETSFKRSKKPSYWCAQGGVYGKGYGASFGCSRQTIHYLVNQYSITGSVRALARPGRTCVTTLSPYRNNTLTHPCNCFYQQPLLLGVYGVHAQTVINQFMQSNGPCIFQHDNVRLYTTRITTQFSGQNNVNVLPWPALSPVLNPIEHVWD